MGVWSYVCEHPLASAVTCFFVVFEGHYLWRLAACLSTSALLPKRRPDAVFRHYSICTLTDLDVFLHMNNARYAREMDFVRWSYYVRTRLHRLCLKNNTRVLHATSAIRFRKEVGLLMPFVVETRLVHWAGDSLYFEQRLKTLHDGRVRSVSYCQQRLVGQLSAEQLLEMAFDGCPPRQLQQPPEIVQQLQALVATSSRQLAQEEGRVV